MAIDLSGIPDASPNVDLSSLPDAPRSGGVDLSGIPDATNDSLTRLENSGGWGLFTNPIETMTGKSMYQRGVENANSPNFMQSKTAPFDKYIPQARQAAENRIVGGSIADMASAPINYAPLPIGHAIGEVVAHMAESGNPLFQGIARWAAKNLPTLAPNLSKVGNAVSPATSAEEQDLLNMIQKSGGASPTPPAAESPIVGPSDLSSSTTTMNPPVPTAPPIETAIKPFTIPKTGKQLGFRELLNPTTKSAAPEAIAQTPFESPLGPVRDQGQQSFDFTQGPARPEVLPQDNAIQLSAQVQKEIDDISRMPNGARPAPYRGLDRAQLQDLFVQRIANKPVKQLAEPFDPYSIPGEMKKLKGGANQQADIYELAATEADRVRREQLIADRQSVDNLVKQQEADPSALEDLGTIIKGLNEKGSTSGGRFTPEANAALDRWRNQHAPAIAEHLKIAGNDVAGYVAKNMPSLTEAQAAQAVHYLTKEKLGNSNISLQNMSPEKAQAAKDLAKNNFVDLNKSTVGKTLSRDESIGRMGTSGAKQAADAISNIDSRDAAAGMTRLGHETNQALEDIVGKNATPEALQTANDALEAYKRAGTTVGRLLQSRKNILANAEEFAQQAQILYENGEISKEALSAISEATAKLRQLPKSGQEKFWTRLHELGVNNMLSVMSNFRNITGNLIAAPLSPATRAIQGGLNMTVARPVNKIAEAVQKGLNMKTAYKPFLGTDVLAREGGQMVKSYIQNFGTGVKVGGRYFMKETDSNVYKSIQKDIAKVTSDTTIPAASKAKKLASLQKQKEAVLETIRRGNQGDQFAEQGGLTHRRSIPGPIGYAVNTPVRALSAMDQTFRIPMRKAAEDAIKLRIGIKNDVPWKDVKLTPEQIADGAHEAAYYTYNQALGSVGKKVQAAAQPKTALGYAIGNVLVFMKNAVNVGKFALDHGALETGSNLLGPMIGPLANMYENKGLKLDTKSLARVAAGLGIAYTSYAAMKKSGMEFYLGSNSSAESDQRKAAGVPTGVYAKDASGKIHDLSQIYPLTFFFRNMAGWDTAKRLAAKGVPEKDAQWSNFKSQADTFLNASTLTGTKDIMTAWDNAMKQADPSDLPADSVDAGSKYLSKQASARLTSAFLDEVNRMFIDKTQRDPHTPAEYFEARTPGLSKNVPAKLSWTGAEIKRPEVRSPLAEMTVGEGNVNKQDPVQKELLSLGIYPPAVAKSQDGIRFTEAERRSVQKQYGPYALSAIKTIMADPGYARMPEFMKYSMIEAALKTQHFGEKAVAGQRALKDIQSYFNLQIDRKTKGRSMSQDRNTSDIFAGNPR